MNSPSPSRPRQDVLAATAVVSWADVAFVSPAYARDPDCVVPVEAQGHGPGPQLDDDEESAVALAQGLSDDVELHTCP